MRFRVLHWFVLLPIVVAGPATVEAMGWTRVPQLFAEIVPQATRAFRGRVQEVRYAVVDVPGVPRPFPYSRITIDVDEAYAGVVRGQRVTIYQAGGLIPGTHTGLMIPGISELQPGEQVALFLDDSSRLHRVLGSAFGEVGLRRIVNHDGENVLLTAGWEAVASDGAVVSYRCRPALTDRARCDGWDSRDGTGGAPGPSLLRMEAFDARVRLARRGAAALPAPMVSEATWREDYLQFLRVGQAPAAVRIH